MFGVCRFLQNHHKYILTNFLEKNWMFELFEVVNGKTKIEARPLGFPGGRASVIKHSSFFGVGR